MEVTLLYSTENPEVAVATAARLCYSPKIPSELFEDMTEDRIRSVLNTVISSGHTSTLEHVSYTFSISGVSRALTHQLVRHRHSSFEQQSQRYVKFKEEPNVVKPVTVANNPEASQKFDTVMNSIWDAYESMVEAGIPAEDARYILPNATETNIMVTMNARELLHFFELRTCNRAQWEIRELALKMLELVRPTAPNIFFDAGPGCVRGHCPEGKMTCGKPWPVVKREA